MIPIVVALVPVGIILIASEMLWRRNVIKGERARKFIHILAGVWMAFWSLYVPQEYIALLGVVALALLVYSRITRLFHAIYAVRRRTYGDVLFALAIIICAYTAQADWIFTVSILFLALADGGAALVGRMWGKKNEYLVFGTENLRKSAVGTAAFIIFVYVAIAVGWLLGGDEAMRSQPLLVFFALPAIASVFENTMPFGLDNIFTPLTATIILNALI